MNEHGSSESAMFQVPGDRLRELGRAERVLLAIADIVDEPLDERVGAHGPTRSGQFARIDAVIRSWRAGPDA